MGAAIEGPRSPFQRTGAFSLVRMTGALSLARMTGALSLSRMTRAFQRAALFLAFPVAWAGAGCTWPWTEVPVSSAISGRLVHQGAPVTSGVVRLQVRSFDNAALGDHIEEPLAPDGSFYFDAISLRVAGQEYRKQYVLLLYWIDDTGASGADGGEARPARTLWRADYARADLGDPVELVCRLGRSEMEGPPCRFVGEIAAQPWLLKAGAQDYRDLCASCHGPTGAGDGVVAGRLSKPVPDLRRIAARRGGVFPLDEVAAIVDGRTASGAPIPSHGTREMPVWGMRLADQYVSGMEREERIRNRIDILVDYLDAMQLP